MMDDGWVSDLDELYENQYDYYDIEHINYEHYYDSNSFLSSNDSMISPNEIDSTEYIDSSSASSASSQGSPDFSESTYNTMSEQNDSDYSRSDSPDLTSGSDSNVNLSLHDHPYIPRSPIDINETNQNITHDPQYESLIIDIETVPSSVVDITELTNTELASTSNNNSNVTPSSENTRPSVIVGTSRINSPGSSLQVDDIQLNLPSSSSSNKIINDNPHSDEPPAKCPKLDLDQSKSDEQNCPICFEPWTNAGEHRMAALKCGHLFGHACILRWIRQMHNKVCPTCKAKSTSRDIRFIYARTLSCIDNSETEAVKAELEQVKEEKNRNELELRKLMLNQETHLKTIKDLQNTINELKSKKGKIANVIRTNWRFYLEKNVEILRDSGCRVFIYHKLSNSLFVSQVNSNPLFPGFGLRQLDCENYKLGQFALLHSKEIRAISYSEYNNIIMSVSLDKDIKLSSPNRDKQITTLSTELPLWSCCWDNDQPNRMYAGGIGGVIMQYDMRQTKSCLSRISPVGDMSPVVSIAPVTSGVISCQLNSVKVHRKNGSAFQSELLPLEGPFQNLNYEPATEQLIVSTRPKALTPYCTHVVCNVDVFGDQNTRCEIVHTFKGASKQTLMSKTSQFSIGQDFLFAAHSEDDRAVHIWSISSQKKMISLTNQDQIIDTCPWTHGSDTFLATLSQNKTKIYKASYE